MIDIDLMYSYIMDIKIDILLRICIDW